MLPWGLGHPIDWEPYWMDHRLRPGHWRVSLSGHFVRLFAAPELRGGKPPTGPNTQLLRIWYYTEYPYLWRVPAHGSGTGTRHLPIPRRRTVALRRTDL